MIASVHHIETIQGPCFACREWNEEMRVRGGIRLEGLGRKPGETIGYVFFCAKCASRLAVIILEKLVMG